MQKNDNQIKTKEYWNQNFS